MGAIKDKLSKGDNAELKQLASSITIYKVAAEGPAGPQVVFVFDLSPVVKTQSYDAVRILYYSKAFPDRAEADAVYKKIGDSLASPQIVVWPVAKVGG